MDQLLATQQQFFASNETLSYAFRMKQLQKLQSLIRINENAIIEALYLDLHKSAYEAYASEIGLVLKSIDIALKRLKRWMRPKRVQTPLYLLNTKSYIWPEPLGSILIIGPYNYPFQLVIEPLIGAISAGNTAIIKPSEQTPHTEQLLVQLINDNFDPQYLHVVTGDHIITQALLALRFDHIFFTGSTRVGQIVYEAASKHLTPVTLELGGKSPTIVDETANLRVAARRIVFGKFLNAGQTCIAPDYIYVHESIQETFAQLIRDTIDAFYGSKDALGYIVNDKHKKRLLGLLGKAPSLSDSLHMNPIVLTDVTWNDAVMKEELFGPILPILPYQSLDDVIHQIRSYEKPLALYLFSNDKHVQRRIWNELSFGGGAINDTVMQFSNPNLPFGGVGASGIGQYHGKHSFDTFSHHKSTVKRSVLFDPPITYPPHTGWKKNLIRWFLR